MFTFLSWSAIFPTCKFKRRCRGQITRLQPCGCGSTVPLILICARDTPLLSSSHHQNLLFQILGAWWIHIRPCPCLWTNESLDTQWKYVQIAFGESVHIYRMLVKIATLKLFREPPHQSFLLADSLHALSLNRPGADTGISSLLSCRQCLGISA